MGREQANRAQPDGPESLRLAAFPSGESGIRASDRLGHQASLYNAPISALVDNWNCSRFASQALCPATTPPCSSPLRHDPQAMFRPSLDQPLKTPGSAIAMRAW